MLFICLLEGTDPHAEVTGGGNFCVRFFLLWPYHKSPQMTGVIPRFLSTRTPIARFPAVGNENEDSNHGAISRVFSALKALGVSSADEAGFCEEETKKDELHEVDLDGSTFEFRAALGSEPVEAAGSEGKVMAGKTFGACFAAPVGA